MSTFTTSDEVKADMVKAALDRADEAEAVSFELRCENEKLRDELERYEKEIATGQLPPSVEVEFSERTHQPGDEEAGIVRGEIRGYPPNRSAQDEDEYQRRRIPYRLEAIEGRLDEIGRAVAATSSKYTDAESREYDETAASEGETDYIRELRTGLECMIAAGKLDSAIESGREICASWVDDHKRLHAVIAELDKLASEEASDVVTDFGAHLCRVISSADEEKP